VADRAADTAGERVAGVLVPRVRSERRESLPGAQTIVEAVDEPRRRPAATTGKQAQNPRKCPVVAHANQLLARRGETPLPEGVSAHKLRHTFASILYVRGEDPPYPIDFRREAVALLKSSDKSVPRFAAELGISPQSLQPRRRRWRPEGGRHRPTSA
jgi:hypothetical protein